MNLLSNCFSDAIEALESELALFDENNTDAGSMIAIIEDEIASLKKLI